VARRCTSPRGWHHLSRETATVGLQDGDRVFLALMPGPVLPYERQGSPLDEDRSRSSGDSRRWSLTIRCLMWPGTHRGKEPHP
jgi:hypothetical protein